MGKRPLHDILAVQSNKRQCIRPLAQKPGAPVDKRKSAPFGNKKLTVPRPFNLSGHGTWRQEHFQKLKQEEEARRQQVETFKPQINPSAKHVTSKVLASMPKKQENKENSGTSGALGGAGSTRTALGTVTNLAHPEADNYQLPLSKAVKGVPMLDKLSIVGHSVGTSKVPDHRPLTARVHSTTRDMLAAAPRHSIGGGRLAAHPTTLERRRVSAFVRPTPPGAEPKPACPLASGGPMGPPAAVAHSRAKGHPADLPVSSNGTVAQSSATGAVPPVLPGKAPERRHHVSRVSRVTFGVPSVITNDARPTAGLVGDKAKAAMGVVGANSRKSTVPSVLPKPTLDRSNSAPLPAPCSRSPIAPIAAPPPVEEEDGSGRNYGPEGYCYIAKGSVFCDGRYTALHQLGEGKYSTVWLMYDRDGPYPEYSNFVAVKVGRAMASTVLPDDIKRESNLLEYINTTHETDDLRYLATVIGSFIHQGRHGLHACMVFKVLGSQVLRLVYERNEDVRNGLPLDMAALINIFKCILRGTAGFHKWNIAHTDLKPENILLAVPDDDVVRKMKEFVRERGLPAPYLEHRPQASLTPNRPNPLTGPVSPGATILQRSSSVDPLDFWSVHSPPNPLSEVDGFTALTPGRPTMACLRREEGVATTPASGSQDVEMSQAMRSPPTAKDQEPPEPEAKGTPAQGTADEENRMEEDTPMAAPKPNFVCAARGGATVADSPLLGMDSPMVTDSPPRAMALKRPLLKDSPGDGLRRQSDAGGLMTPQTPPHVERRVNPGTPQYVLEQGTNTDVLIGDFGLAMVLENAHPLAAPGVLIYPQDCVVVNHNHGMVIQTREYRAPEVLLGQDFNVKIDIYSIACIMVELMTGEYLWDPKHTVPKRSGQVEQEIDREHLQHMIAVLGAEDLPKLTSRRTCFKSRFFLPNGEVRIPPARKRRPKSHPLVAILAPHVPQAMLADMAHLLTKMLAFHPNDRWSAEQCLQYLDRPVFQAVGRSERRYSRRNSR